MNVTFMKIVENIMAKEKLHIMSNFSFCHNFVQKASAAEVSESVYMRERVD